MFKILKKILIFPLILIICIALVALVNIRVLNSFRTNTHKFESVEQYDSLKLVNGDLVLFKANLNSLYKVTEGSSSIYSTVEYGNKFLVMVSENHQLNGSFQCKNITSDASELLESTIEILNMPYQPAEGETVVDISSVASETAGNFNDDTSLFECENVDENYKNTTIAILVFEVVALYIGILLILHYKIFTWMNK